MSEPIQVGFVGLEAEPLRLELIEPSQVPIGFLESVIRGPAGANFQPDATGLLADRGDFDGEAPGFAFLATDTGDLYFREGATSGGWSAPVPFGGSGGGDVDGPASSVDGRAALFDGTTGKLLKQSSAAPVLEGDARLSNARTPTTHAASHGDGGSDEITVSQDQVTGLVTALAGKESAGAAAAAVTAHEGAADPHPQYLTQTEGDGRYRQSSTALTDSDIPAGIARDSEVTAAITAHEAAADPHPGYLTQTEGDGRYRQTATALTDSDIPAGIARDSEVTAAITAHEGAADPHPGYLTAAEGNAAYAPLAQGVTNGNSHDHSGGDGAQIAYASLSGLPTLGTAAATNSTAYGPALTTNAAVTAGTNAQGSGVLTADVNVITSTPNNPSGVTLPAATVNDPPVVIINRGTNPVNVYPASGAQIDTAGTNNPYSLAVGARFDVIATSATQWQSSSVERTSVSFLAGTGTGVNTALAVNVGSAGAFVVNGGVLGTPSSGTLTNCTGLPAAGVTGLGSLATLSALGSITSAGAIGSTANLPIITTTGGALSVGSFGTTANTFCQGNDARLSDARTPLSHTHGNISNAGAIGSTANVPIITGTSGVLQAGSFGTTANTFCQGNDSRLSDARTPTAHNQAWSTITATPTTLAGYGITDAQPLDSDLTSIAALTTTTFGRQFLDRADAAAGRTHLGLGTLATQSGTFSGTSSGTNTGDQAISSSSNATSHTVTLSASGGSLQLVEGTNITLTTTGTAADAVVTIAATGGGGGSLTVQDEGSNLSTSVATINFTGAGVTATGTSTVTVDIPGGGGGGNAFSTIAVTGQSDVVADSSTDTLTIAAGAGMAITTNASTDTVTLAATGPSLGLTLAIAYGMAMP